MGATYRETSNQICAAVRACVPQLQAATEATDRDRQLPQDVLAALREAGSYRMLGRVCKVSFRHNTLCV